MITYSYECRACGYAQDIEQSIKDDALTICPKCKKAEFRRIITGPPLYVKVHGEPTTIGQLATKNAKKLGNEQMAKMKERQKTKKTISRIPEDQRPTSPTSPPTDTQPMPEWVTKSRTKTNTEITKMTTEKQEKYIFTGE